MKSKEQQLSVLVVDSKSKTHPDWVKECIQSIERQTNKDIEIVVLDNREMFYTGGRMYNQGMREAIGKWVAIVNEDDFIGPDWCEIIQNMSEEVPDDCVCISTYCTFYDDETGRTEKRNVAPLGAYRRKYMLEHPFIEHLNKYIDVNALEDLQKDGKQMITFTKSYGYFYRLHKDQISGKKKIGHAKNFDVIFVAKQHNFIEPYAVKFEQAGYTVGRYSYLPDKIEDSVKIVWCDWGDEQAVKLSMMDIKAKKILRIHSYEAYTDNMDKINWKAWDKIIFVAEHIKRYTEERVGKLNNAVVIPNAIDLNKFTMNDETEVNSIAYVGHFKDVKGIQLLLHVAKEFPEYKFYLKGESFEKDIEQYMKERKPDNVIYEEAGDNVKEFLSNKQYIINTSRRESQCLALLEGSACGCKPLIYNWIGSKELYGNEYVWNTFADLKKLLGPTSPSKYRKFVEDNHDIEKMFLLVKEVIDGLIK